MKTFLVFLSVLLVAVFFFSFSTDLMRYVNVQEALKRFTEEAAAGCALFADETSYAKGILRLSEEEGNAYLEARRIDLQNSWNETLPGQLEMSLTIDNDCPRPTCTVRATYRLARDLFRLPFLTVTAVTREGTYEVRGY